jgi:hypothetical protein
MKFCMDAMPLLHSLISYLQFHSVDNTNVRDCQICEVCVMLLCMHDDGITHHVVFILDCVIALMMLISSVLCVHGMWCEEHLWNVTELQGIYLSLFVHDSRQIGNTAQ